MVSKGAALLLLPLLQGASADWTTTIKANLIVSNGFAPVIDFTTTPPPGAATPSSTPATSTPLTFDHKHSHREQFTTIVTVRDGMTPLIHFSPILSSHTSTEGGGETSSEPAVETSSTPPPGEPTDTSTPVVPPVTPTSTSTSTPYIPSTSSSESVPPIAPSSVSSSVPYIPSSSSSSVPLMPSSSSSSAPVIPTTSRPGQQSSSRPAPAGGTSSESTISSLPGQSNSNSNAPTNTPGSSTPLSPGSTGSDTSSSTKARPTAPLSSSGPKPTSGGLSAAGSVSSYAPSAQLSSVDLSSAPDLNSISPTGTDSAINDFKPTGEPTSEPWATLTPIPSGTITGTPAASEATNLAVYLHDIYNNIDDLKKDPEDYKNRIEDIETQSEDYLSKVNFDATKSPCSGSLRKRSLFSAIGNLASEAADATVNTAKDIADAAISCIKPVVDDITSKIPEDPVDITNDVENTIKKGTEYLDEIGNIVDNMEEKQKDDNKSSSQSESSTESSSSSTSSSSTSSSTSSCSSSTTFSDCTTKTVLISTYSKGADGSTSPATSTTTTTTCSTGTACNASPTSMETTTKVGSCKLRRTTSLAPYTSQGATSIPYIPSSSGSGGSSGSAAPGSSNSPSIASPTAPPGSGTSTSSASSTYTTSCRAYHIVDQKDSMEYCMFNCAAFSGTYPIAKSTSGQSNYQPCPYSTPPASTYTQSNAGPFTTTMTDGTVYTCGDSRWQNRVVNKAKSCVTSMSPVSVVSSIYYPWSSAQASKAAVASSSRASVSRSIASTSSASAAAASPTDQIYIAYEDPQGWGFYVYWALFNVAMDDTDPNWCDLNMLGETEASGDISVNDVPNPPSIDFSDDADVSDSSFSDCSYDGDSATLTCPDFSVQCETDIDSSVAGSNCWGVMEKTEYVPKVRCQWGAADMNS